MSTDPVDSTLRQRDVTEHLGGICPTCGQRMIVTGTLELCPKCKFCRDATPQYRMRNGSVLRLDGELPEAELFRGTDSAEEWDHD